MQGRRLDLDDKALGAQHRRELRLEKCGRNLAIVLDVVCEIDGRHAAPPELALDAIAVRKRVAETFGVRRKRRVCGH